MKTIIEHFETAVINYPGNVYLWEKKNGKYEGTTYKKTHEQVLNLGAGLVSMEFNKGDRTGLIADGQTLRILIPESKRTDLTDVVAVQFERYMFYMQVSSKNIYI